MNHDSEQQDYAHNFTDLMSSLAIIFLILAVAVVCSFYLSRNSAAKKYEHLTTLHSKVIDSKGDLLKNIKEIFNMNQSGNSFSTTDNCIHVDGVSNYKVVLKFDGENIKCRNSGLFYKSNEYQLPKLQTSDTILKLSKIYVHICKSMVNDIDNIEILGHTDSLPSKLDNQSCRNINSNSDEQFNNLHCNNIYLSAQRARDVFLQVGQKFIEDKKTFHCLTEKTVISGRGPFATISNNNTANRRVEVIINFKQPSIELLEK